jgi:hypothetical protein
MTQATDRSRTRHRPRVWTHALLAVAVLASLIGTIAVPATPAAAETCPPASAAPFPDVPTGHPFCREIALAASVGIVEGYSDGTFRPGQPITRQAVAAILWRAANAEDGFPLPPCAAAPFSDVPISHPFCGEIQATKVAGVFEGYPDGTFRPGQNITRQAVAAVITRFPDPIPLPVCFALPFVDVPETHAFCPNIMALKLSGVATGFPDGTFRPAEDVTRQAFVTLLVRWIAFLDT